MDLAAEIGETYSVPYAHSLISLISFHRNDVNQGAACAEAASREFAGRGGQGTRPLDLALASEDAATAFVKHGDVEQSRRLLGQATSIYERLGATRDLARADAVLRQAGIRRGIRGARNRPEFGWDSLPPPNSRW